MAPRKATRACSPRSNASGRIRRNCSRRTSWTARWRTAVSPRDSPTCAPRGRRGSTRCSPRRRSSDRANARISMVRQARRAQRAFGLHARGHAVPAAGLSGGPLVNAAASADARFRTDRVAAAWRALGLVEDPEIPALTLVDLGIVRFVTPRSDGVLEVGLSPTYTGCPATEFIRGLVERALARRRSRGDRGHAGSLARLEQRLDHAGGAEQARRLRHRAAVG